MLIICSYAGGPPAETVDFREYDFTQLGEHQRYWDVLIENTLAGIADREDLDDDWMPGVEAYYGFGSFGAVYCDAPLTFTETTSYIEPALARLADLDALDLASERFWARLFVNSARYLSEKSEGRFLVSAYPNPSPWTLRTCCAGMRSSPTYTKSRNNSGIYLTAAWRARLQTCDALHKPPPTLGWNVRVQPLDSAGSAAAGRCRGPYLAQALSRNRDALYTADDR